MSFASNGFGDRYSAAADHHPTRPVDKAKAESDLSINIKKATSTEETAPKPKHVRKAIVYTWDYRSSHSIWTGLRVLPILSDEVSAFKALVFIHKVLQDGHQSCLREAQDNADWLESCSRAVGSEGQRGYGPLIRAYVTLLLAKLRFHKNHRDFNGVFDYQEYVTLRGIDDPNEGYETITDLMTLQDQIDSFQKLIFAHFRASTNNECRISALVPQVKESYGIYRFVTSMLRAMNRQIEDGGILEPLRTRFASQHHNLRRFYYECSNLKYLTALINVPKLPQDPPNLTDVAPEYVPTQKTDTPAPKEPPRAPSADINEQARMLKEFEDKKAEQTRLQNEREAEQRRNAEQAARSQREFEEQQRMQEERDRQAQEDLARQQAMQQQQMQQQQYSGRQMELERDILAMRGQYERDQMMLEQYDRRVKALETELAGIGNNIQAQLNSKDEMQKSLMDQVTLWRNKYEALAKLYTQLRAEHLDLLAKQKAISLKANSAQESIDKMERMEKDMKNKNMELADMIRERDRARFESDRMKSSQKEDLERLKRDLRFAEERAEDATRNKSSEVSGLLGKYNRQLNDLEESLRSKQMQIDDLLLKIEERNGEVERVRQEKDQEIEIMQFSLDETTDRLVNSHTDKGEADSAVNAQIDALLLDQHNNLNKIIDSILQGCVTKVDDSMYDLESDMSVGNSNATPQLSLSAIEQAQTSVMEFSSVFSAYLANEKGGEHVQVIMTANSLAQAVTEVLGDVKGITRLATDDDAADKLIKRAKTPGEAIVRFLLSLQSSRLQGSSLSTKREIVMSQNMESRNALQTLATAVEQLVPKSSMKANGDIGNLVEQEMSAAARAIEDATNRLQGLMNRPKDSSRHSSIDIQVHDAILQAAMSITGAIGRLIAAATSSQQEIVAQGKGSSSAQAFYKKNNRWTEGLVSAARAVAWATTTLIETADGVVSGTRSLDQLIVASNEVAAATAQLVQASRVKSSFMSKTQENLERAARAVSDACKALVKQVKAITAKQMQNDEETLDYGNMASHEFKTREMEAAVEVISAERRLTDARRKLAEMRKLGYANDESI